MSLLLRLGKTKFLKSSVSLTVMSLKLKKILYSQSSKKKKLRQQVLIKANQIRSNPVIVMTQKLTLAPNRALTLI